jgi:hypothetical protein
LFVIIKGSVPKADAKYLEYCFKDPGLTSCIKL